MPGSGKRRSGRRWHIPMKTRYLGARRWSITTANKLTPSASMRRVDLNRARDAAVENAQDRVLRQEGAADGAHRRCSEGCLRAASDRRASPDRVVASRSCDFWSWSSIGVKIRPIRMLDAWCLLCRLRRQRCHVYVDLWWDFRPTRNVVPVPLATPLALSAARRAWS
jgi:hypothetical protein